MKKQGELRPGLAQIGKGRPGVPGSGAFMLPPAPGLCQECAHKHEPEMPHNQQSIYYQYAFANKHGRWPTWKDAMAHCSPEMQRVWQEELEKKGVWSEPKEDLNPEEKTAHILMGSDLPSKVPTMEPGNLMKMEVIEMGDGLKRAKVAANVTRLPVKPKVGQIWADNDPRMQRRLLEILSIDGTHAVCKVGSGTRTTKVRLDRFKPTQTGYRLEKDV